MSERKILSKILRIDKNIYSELINFDNALQKGILIYITVTSLNTLSQTRFFISLLDPPEKITLAFGNCFIIFVDSNNRSADPINII